MLRAFLKVTTILHTALSSVLKQNMFRLHQHTIDNLFISPEKIFDISICEQYELQRTLFNQIIYQVFNLFPTLMDVNCNVI